jgi:hypothetical protein
MKATPMSNNKSPQANIAGRIAGAAVAGALLLAGPIAAVAMAGPAAAAPGTTNIDGVEYTDEEIATNLNKSLPGPGFFSLDSFVKGSITNGIITDFFH